VAGSIHWDFLHICVSGGRPLKVGLKERALIQSGNLSSDGWLLTLLSLANSKLARTAMSPALSSDVKMQLQDSLCRAIH
jgi:hypothetical protein